MRRALSLATLVLAIALLPVARCLAEHFHTKVTVGHTADDKSAGNAGVVVWLTPLDSAPPRLPVVHPLLAKKNKGFQPHLLVIPVGTVVDFPNEDPFFHNVFSLYKGKRFDLGLYEAGGSRTLVFAKPGVFFFFFHIHPQLKCY